MFCLVDMYLVHRKLEHSNWTQMHFNSFFFFLSGEQLAQITLKRNRKHSAYGTQFPTLQSTQDHFECELVFQTEKYIQFHFKQNGQKWHRFSGAPWPVEKWESCSAHWIFGACELTLIFRSLSINKIQINLKSTKIPFSFKHSDHHLFYYIFMSILCPNRAHSMSVSEKEKQNKKCFAMASVKLWIFDQLHRIQSRLIYRGQMVSSNSMRKKNMKHSHLFSLVWFETQPSTSNRTNGNVRRMSKCQNEYEHCCEFKIT